MIFPTAYLPSIFQLIKMIAADSCAIEQHEHFTKQSYRNRCEIYGANGRLSLSIPLQKWKNHSLVKDIKISYAENWQKLHWKSMESAYRTSPYFEFYEEEFISFYTQQKHTYLIDFNSHIMSSLLDNIGLDFQIQITDKYQIITASEDWRTLIHPKKKKAAETVEFPKYMQVFDAKYGFIPNLSAIDLLFNLGPQSKQYLYSIINSTTD